MAEPADLIRRLDAAISTKSLHPEYARGLLREARAALVLARTLSALDGAMHSVWLNGNWEWLLKEMTTEQKEAATDAVERYSTLLEPGDGACLDRWWRKSACGCVDPSECILCNPYPDAIEGAYPGNGDWLA
jgi:hypothetical protein